MEAKFKVGDIILYDGTFRCRVTALWSDEGKDGVTIVPTGNYGFPRDVFCDQNMVKVNRYFDKNGEEIHDDMSVLFTGENITHKVYATTDGELGTDATNPHWIETGRAVECEYGVYPLPIDWSKPCKNGDPYCVYVDCVAMGSLVGCAYDKGGEA